MTIPKRALAKRLLLANVALVIAACASTDGKQVPIDTDGPKPAGVTAGETATIASIAVPTFSSLPKCDASNDSTHARTTSTGDPWTTTIVEMRAVTPNSRRGAWSASARPTR